MDINTCVLPEDEASLTHTKYHIHKLIDSASTKFRSYIRAHFTVIMPTIVSDPDIFYPHHRKLTVGLYIGNHGAATKLNKFFSFRNNNIKIIFNDSFLQSGDPIKTPIETPEQHVMKTKMKLTKMKFDSLEEDHSYKKLQLGKLSGPKLTAIVHREMDLPIFW